MLRTFRYRRTACFVIEAADGRDLAVEAGWPGTFLEYARGLKAAGGRFERLAWAVVTHFHPDHAGLVGEFQARGIECVTVDGQAAAIDAMERVISRSWPEYRRVSREALTRLSSAGSRAWLEARGIAGTILPTPGHSDDSVSLVLDSGEALVGDLTLPPLVTPDDTTARRSWARITAAGGRLVLPAHAPPFSLEHGDPRLTFPGAEP